MKELFIFRGLPGQGKSHLAQILKKALDWKTVYLSADDLRISYPEGTYEFNPDREPYIWEEFEKEFQEALEDPEVKNIIIDNINLKLINYYHFKQDALDKGFNVHEIIVGDFDVEKSYVRGQHNVPFNKLEEMKKAFEFPIIL